MLSNFNNPKETRWHLIFFPFFFFQFFFVDAMFLNTWPNSSGCTDAIVPWNKTKRKSHKNTQEYFEIGTMYKIRWHAQRNNLKCFHWLGRLIDVSPYCTRGNQHHSKHKWFFLFFVLSFCIIFDLRWKQEANLYPFILME